MQCNLAVDPPVRRLLPPPPKPQLWLRCRSQRDLQRTPYSWSIGTLCSMPAERAPPISLLLLRHADAALDAVVHARCGSKSGLDMENSNCSLANSASPCSSAMPSRAGAAMATASTTTSHKPCHLILPVPEQRLSLARAACCKTPRAPSRHSVSPFAKDGLIASNKLRFSNKKRSFGLCVIPVHSVRHSNPTLWKLLVHLWTLSFSHPVCHSPRPENRHPFVASLVNGEWRKLASPFSVCFSFEAGRITGVDLKCCG
ncbi:hypothetical protein FN846DRAFT_952118 [Sphaerosporella brunnea]|uniref:Uncharacterized protein n=1 Tax=Sphaerosporella brunnea TaxID=1250544 RepID=A0A5J5EVP5_9PEZI|nr:hypothetical protein FN846DRAFT_952118 [Sphaerosporella brunnea]